MDFASRFCIVKIFFHFVVSLLPLKVVGICRRLFIASFDALHLKNEFMRREYGLLESETPDADARFLF
jgi:hypothetical protein